VTAKLNESGLDSERRSEREKLDLDPFLSTQIGMSRFSKILQTLLYLIKI